MSSPPHFPAMHGTRYNKRYRDLRRSVDAAEEASAAKRRLIERHNLALRRPEPEPERPPGHSPGLALAAKGVWFRTRVVTDVRNAHSRAEYDRRAVPIKQCTTQNKAKIAKRLNAYKRHEMPTHTKSRRNTQYHEVASSCCGLGSGLQYKFVALTRGFRRFAV